MNSALLLLSSVEKRLPNGRVLFRALDFALARGEFVAIMGESGIGKSTLLNIVAGLDTVDAGTVRFDGRDIAALDDDTRTLVRRDRMGFVFQAFHVLPHLTIAQNVALPLVLQRLSRKEIDERAQAMLASVGLAGRGDEFPAVLSGGELQRVAIARALIHRPTLLLLDEPTGNLDPETAARILALIDQRRRDHDAATLLVTHSEVAAAKADRVLHLRESGLAEDAAASRPDRSAVGR
ncbi:MAG: ABC transporter ATP-binding protein [Burkholderiaceae bacterium]